MEHDYISDLPQSIIRNILTRLDLRDAVCTSILSRKWRYKWADLRELVFDDYCVEFSETEGITVCDDIKDSGEKLVTFITQFLLLHQGPIDKFKLHTDFLLEVPDIQQWLLFLSRQDVKELSLEVGVFFRVPSSIFCCLKLTSLKLVLCELGSPPNFKGFSFLKCLDLKRVLVPHGVLDRIISGCPLLEKLCLEEMDHLSLTVHAPNLKYLDMFGEYIDMFLEHTPLLAGISVYMDVKDDVEDTDDMDIRVRQSSGCMFDKFLGGVSCLEMLTGNVTKYLNVGNGLGKTPIRYDCLKLIDLNDVSFVDTKESLVLLHMILNSRNLEELRIFVWQYASAKLEAPKSGFWLKELRTDGPFKRLKTVKISYFTFLSLEMEFIRFVLASSPVLEVMRLVPCEVTPKMTEILKYESFCKS